MRQSKLLLMSPAVFFLAVSLAHAGGDSVSDETIAEQRAALAQSTKGAGFGPQ